MKKKSEGCVGNGREWPFKKPAIHLLRHYSMIIFTPEVTGNLGASPSFNPRVKFILVMWY